MVRSHERTAAAYANRSRDRSCIFSPLPPPPARSTRRSKSPPDISFAFLSFRWVVERLKIKLPSAAPRDKSFPQSRRREEVDIVNF